MAAVERRCRGVGLGWRTKLADSIGTLLAVDFVEVLAEHFGPLPPPALLELVDAGIPAVIHSVGQSLGSVERPDPVRLRHLDRLSTTLRAPYVSDHAAFVRGGGDDGRVLLPLPRTREALDVIIEHVRIAQDSLAAPFAIENVAAPFEWPESEMDEIDFICEVLERTGCWLLFDVANLYANCVNFGWDVARWIERLPAERVAYMHVAGGAWREGRYHDTHAHDVPLDVMELLAEFTTQAGPGVLLERDRRFEVDAVRQDLEKIGRIRDLVKQ